MATSVLPLAFATGNWYTIKYIASRLGKNPRTVHYWVENGLFAKMGLKVIVAHNRIAASRGITWIQIPNNRTYAMFKRVHLDIPPIPKLPLSRNEGSI